MFDDQQPTSSGRRRTGPPASDITIAIADDDARVRLALLALLDGHPRFETIGSVGSGIELAQICAAVRPRIALVDVMMPGGGEAAIRAVRAASPDTTVVVYTAWADRPTTARMLAAGARTVVAKGARQPLVDALIALCDG